MTASSDSMPSTRCWYFMNILALTLPERQHWLPAPGPEPHLPDAALRIPVKNELPPQLGHVEVALALGAERQLRHVRHSDDETVAVSEDGEGRTRWRLIFADVAVEDRRIQHDPRASLARRSRVQA